MKNSIIYTLAIVMVGLSMMSCENDGLKNTPVSGYKYIPHKVTGGAVAQVGDQVYFQMDILDDQDSILQSYRDQKVLPSLEMVSIEEPSRKKNAIIDVLAVMAVGDSVDLLIPVDSIPQMPPGFEDMEFLTYRLVCMEILTAEENAQRIAEFQAEAAAALEASVARRPEIEAFSTQAIKDYKAGKFDLEESPLGVKYIIHKRGDGELPTQDRLVSMQYFGRVVSTGEYFDDSFKKGQPFSFRLGRRSVIAGWEDVIPLLPEGSTASIFIPSELGYGERGSGPNIGPNEELYFYLECEEVLY